MCANVWGPSNRIGDGWIVDSYAHKKHYADKWCLVAHNSHNIAMIQISSGVHCPHPFHRPPATYHLPNAHTFIFPNAVFGILMGCEAINKHRTMPNAKSKRVETTRCVQMWMQRFEYLIDWMACCSSTSFSSLGIYTIYCTFSISISRQWFVRWEWVQDLTEKPDLLFRFDCMIHGCSRA